ncbi:SPOR domain-containing protein [Clostridium perfringens]
MQPVAIGGRTLYRLRVNAGSANQAADICGRLRVAGESCFVAG